MNTVRHEIISRELNISAKQVADTEGLFTGGATVPFIARYRKEVTGSLDEVVITAIRDRLRELQELDSRREAVLKSLTQRHLLTQELEEKITAATTLSVLEDIYLPFRPKRRTRATIAREKGLEPLAEKIFAQENFDLASEAALFMVEEKGVATKDDALAGARDIIAEWVAEDMTARAKMRDLFMNNGMMRSKVLPDKHAAGSKYKDYFDWEEPVATAPSHRVLAMRRGEREEFLSLRMTPSEEAALAILEELFVKGTRDAAVQVRLAVADSYKRLLSLSMETEIRMETRKRADETAIRVFADNLRQLLLSPPAGQKSVLAIDPGFRTGCKLVCLDRQGKLLHHDTIFPMLSDKARQEAARTVESLCGRFGIEAIAVGNGTAGRETESFLRSLNLPGEILVVMVNESGASVYSASEVARQEFPDHDITVRGAVSIGRRLMDPLSELVKIDPKAIGVGQYQHDVDQGLLRQCLDDVVVSCVNAVGVEVNTAGAPLLSYVSGLGPALAENIVKHRDENGPFLSREALKAVKRLGAKAFEQAAGFLRVRDSKNLLDASAVHPESYPIVEKMAADQGSSVADLMTDAEKRQKIILTDYVTDTVGLPTLKDIVAELAKPGRDPRERFENVVFAEGIDKMADLVAGMKLNGLVTNITAFGAFVDIGVHQDGLVHVSEMADRFVKAPAEVLKVGQKVEVRVLAVDVERKRISLSMKKKPGEKLSEPKQAPDTPHPVERRTEPGRPPRRPEKIKPGEARKPFNNPFADALKKK
jgi:uncharacterized protein